MNNQKPIEFQASPLDFFILSVLSIILVYIPLFGWAYLLTYSGEWFAKRSRISGRGVAFHADYVENLKFLSINVLLLIVTFGIYSFWFYPKLYRYMTERVSFTDDIAGAPAQAAYGSPIQQVQSAAIPPQQPMASQQPMYQQPQTPGVIQPTQQPPVQNPYNTPNQQGPQV